MKYLISPAKTLDLDSIPPTNITTTPLFLDEAQTLIDTIKPYSPSDIATLMKLSDKLSTLNVERYQSWDKVHTESNSRPAVFTFMGDVYTGLDAYSLTPDSINTAQNNLRILSGLYGLLKPLDKMQAYRLEMGTRLKNPNGSNLYQYWGDKIADELENELAEDELLVNLASTEYFKAVNTKRITKKIITPNFLDEKNGQFKVISFYAKKARGMMVRYLIDTNANSLDALKDFNYGGYKYDNTRSTALEPIFIRFEKDQPAKK